MQTLNNVRWDDLPSLTGKHLRHGRLRQRVIAVTLMRSTALVQGRVTTLPNSWMIVTEDLDGIRRQINSTDEHLVGKMEVLDA